MGIRETKETFWLLYLTEAPLPHGKYLRKISRKEALFIRIAGKDTRQVSWKMLDFCMELLITNITLWIRHGRSHKHEERMWGSAKWRNKKQRGTACHHLDSYLIEFIWCQAQAVNGEDGFQSVLKAIAKRFPPKNNSATYSN
ncbi:hypothetical protein TNCT_336231 [Trichonephila clavata]|uniref:Uncharacterized protein n=1 Tax=Trichonephila clavata TaxID=2740835 RepID=A0A8X6HYB1_TRICU|nr:hypothetical protein TNCT_336231 [Trichonephila clavata]